MSKIDTRIIFILCLLHFCSPFLLPKQNHFLGTKQFWSSEALAVVVSLSTVEDVESSTNPDTFMAPSIEIDRRRNLAIISHPDSGKTTMTEKLLLYGGALQQAGAVRQKAQQRGTASDFMEIEMERGISISSTVMNFEYDGCAIRLMDTPGHQDFSEDTYRALAAADNALLLIDAAKGLEPQTRKLFEVCRLRNLPVFTFANKLDRPALSPYEIMDQIEKEFQLEMCPIFWPIGDGDRFKGVLDRTTQTVHVYQKAQQRGKKAIVQHIPLSDTEALRSAIGDDELLDKLMEDAELLEELVPDLDHEKVLAGQQSPLFFGSAMTNFGVQEFLTKFIDMGAKPVGRTNEEATLVPPEHAEFTGFIFKTQANLDPKHRDRLAYVRIVSGTYRKGMKVSHSRSKHSKKYTLSQAQALMGADRSSVEIAYPGDVIGKWQNSCLSDRGEPNWV
jgi:peptide chain release factor 3